MQHAGGVREEDGPRAEAGETRAKGSARQPVSADVQAEWREPKFTDSRWNDFDRAHETVSLSLPACVPDNETILVRTTLHLPFCCEYSGAPGISM